MVTHRQKRLLVLGRLTEVDASSLSDRAIARELGVSQPFVGAVRRRRAQRTVSEAGRDTSHAHVPGDSSPAFSERDEAASLSGDAAVLQTPQNSWNERLTTSERPLDRFPGARRSSYMTGMGVIRDHTLWDWDPFA